MQEINELQIIKLSTTLEKAAKTIFKNSDLPMSSENFEKLSDLARQMEKLVNEFVEGKN